MSEITIGRAAAALEYCLSKRTPCMFWGAPGIGKTQIVYQTGAALSLPVIVYQASLGDPTDVKGLPDFDRSGGITRVKWAQPSDFPYVDRDGPRGILFIDEINTATPAMMASLMRLVLEGRSGDYVMPPEWFIVAAANRLSDRASANAMPTALANRFRHFDVIAEIAPKPTSSSDWGSWALRSGISPYLVAFLRRNPGLLHVMPKDRNERSFPTPRSWERLAGALDAPDDLRQVMFAGDVGDEAAGALVSFLRNVAKCPSLDDIERDPKGCKTFADHELDCCYAVVEMMTRGATPRNFDALMTYAGRLSAEYSASFVRGATDAKPELTNTGAFQDWSVRNSKLVA